MNDIFHMRICDGSSIAFICDFKINNMTQFFLQNIAELIKCCCSNLQLDAKDNRITSHTSNYWSNQFSYLLSVI